MAVGPPPENEENETKITSASKEDCLEWLNSYRKLLRVSIDQYHHILMKPNWIIIPSAESTELVQVYEILEPGSAYHTLKAVAVLSVRPERLMYVIRDHNEDTRMAWDSEYMVSCKELESFHLDTEVSSLMRVVQSEVSMGIPLHSNRELLGIDWWRYDGDTKLYEYVFHTTTHRFFTCNTKKNTVVDALVGVTIRTLERGQCELTMVVYANLGAGASFLIYNACRERMRERVHLYDRVVRNWNKYYTRQKSTAWRSTESKGKDE